MSDAVVAPAAEPSPAPSPALSHDGPRDPAEFAQIRGEDGNPQYVRRADLPAETRSTITSTSTSARPAWCPESCWTDAGFDQAAFDRHYSETIKPALDRENADAVRRNTLPSSPDAYEAKTSPAFKLPEGAEFKIDAGDPMWIAAKNWAHENGLTQQQFEQGIDLIAGREAYGFQKVQTALNREIAKLGPAGATRVQAIENFYAGLLGADAAKAMVSRIFNASDVYLHEMTMRKFSGQRGGSVTQPKPARSDDSFGSVSEKYNYAKQFSNGAR